MVGRDYLLGGHVHADVDKEPRVELAMVCHPRHRLADHDVATEESREARRDLYGQSTESRMDVYRKHWDVRDIPHGHLSQEHDVEASRSMHPDGDWSIYYWSCFRRPKDKNIRLEYVVCHHDGILPHRIYAR